MKQQVRLCSLLVSGWETEGETADVDSSQQLKVFWKIVQNFLVFVLCIFFLQSLFCCVVCKPQGPVVLETYYNSCLFFSSSFLFSPKVVHFDFSKL